jgi:hypothetical protein
MSPEIWTALGVVLVVVIAGVLLFRTEKGFYPGSTLIVEDPPIEHNGLEVGQARFMFFYTTWCPWCKKAQAPWRTFKQQLKNTPVLYGDYNVRMEEINAEVDKGKSALYKVNAYPTFKVETIDKVITFKGVPDPLTFDAFLTSALGAKTSRESPGTK